MKLQFQSPHLSIDEFESVEIPDFVVLTGVNGSGKSHLIQAISQKKVLIEGLPNPIIVQFNYETFKLDNESAFNAQQLSSEREAAWNYLEQHIRPRAPQWRGTLGEEYGEIKESCSREHRSLWSLAVEPIKQYRQQITDYFKSGNRANNDQARSILSMTKTLPYSIDEVDKDDFLRRYKPFNFKSDFLPAQLGKIFWDYYVRFSTNQYHRFRNETDNTDFPVFSDSDFTSTYGQKPWEMVNDILSTFDSLKYRVNSPEGLDIFGNYKLKLEHVDKPGLEVEFAALSSGERILMALVASVYKASSDQIFPDVLLLDEVDASLHPSMMNNMLDVIRSVFLSHGVKVILVSHSPTTIALAPEESIFIMNRGGTKRIEKRSKQEALDILTEGYATIDQGLRIFDEVARSPITLITEGHNACLINKAFELFDVEGVDVVQGVEHISGKSQLRTLFDFLSKTEHQNQVIFVWDCDVTYALEGANRTHPFIIPRNDENTLARRGIENAFPEHLFSNFIKTIRRANGEEIREFDESQKASFAEFVCSSGQKSDFVKFQGLIEKISQLKEETHT